MHPVICGTGLEESNQAVHPNDLRLCQLELEEMRGQDMDTLPWFLVTKISSWTVQLSAILSSLHHIEDYLT
jgi:hypothetical protein